MADPTPTLLRLHALGFRLATDARLGPPALRLELALREFQRYASEEKLASENSAAPGTYADRLTSVPNTAKYTGKVHGHLDADTEKVMQEWERKENAWRCPVVIEAWWTKWTNRPNPAGGRELKWHERLRVFEDPAAQNLWLFDQGNYIKGKLSRGGESIAANQRVRMYAIDFTGRFVGNPVYDVLAKEDKGRILIGHHENKAKKNQNGPVASPDGGEVLVPVTPELITGTTYDKLSRGSKVLYRIARAVSNAECFGFLDSFTAYDRAIVSIGLCHWTLSRFASGSKTEVERGELEAFCAYLKLAYPGVYTDVIGRFDLEPMHEWYKKDGTATGLVVSDLRKFDSHLMEFVWDETNGTAVSREVPRDINRYNMFRSWHWLYRFHIALRVLDKLPLAMWDMIRFRIRDILAVKVPTSLGIPENIAGTPLVLGDIFRSEELITLLVEWHVLSPSTLLSGGEPSPTLSRAIQAAGKSEHVPLTKPPKEWKAAAESSLKNAILATIAEDAKKNRIRLSANAIKDRLAIARDPRFPNEPHPETKEKRLSLRRFPAGFVLFDDPNLFPPPKWKS